MNIKNNMKCLITNYQIITQNFIDSKRNIIIHLENEKETAIKLDNKKRLIKYLKSRGQNELIQHLIQSVINSSQFKYTGLWERNTLYGENKEITELEQSPTLENKQNLTECGHSDLYRCYIDSDKCLLCDLLKVI